MVHVILVDYSYLQMTMREELMGSLPYLILEMLFPIWLFWREGFGGLFVPTLSRKNTTMVPTLKTWIQRGNGNWRYVYQSYSIRQFWYHLDLRIIIGAPLISLWYGIDCQWHWRLYPFFVSCWRNTHRLESGLFCSFLWWGLEYFQLFIGGGLVILDCMLWFSFCPCW